jgi:hypothetical protein
MLTSAKMFYGALTVSLAAHVVTAFVWPQLARTPPSDVAANIQLTAQQFTPTAVETSHLQAMPRQARKAVRTQGVMRTPQHVAGRAARGTAMQGHSLSTMAAELGAGVERPSTLTLPRVIDLSNLSADLKNYPEYLQYFQTIRERIRHYAQRNFPYAGRVGMTYLTFVVTAGGHLESVEVDTNRSTRDATVLQASTSSIHQAAPFPPFPGSFQEPQIPFRIVIEYNISP